MLGDLRMLVGATYVSPGSRFRSGAEMGAERYSGELALHSFGTEPDSWHGEEDL